MDKDRQEFLEFALQLASVAEEKILPYYYNCAVNTKSDGTEVTEADRRAEEVMQEMITRQFS